MHYILDGYNVIRNNHWHGGRSMADDDGSQLLIFLQGYCRKHPSVNFMVMFDGWGSPPASTGNISIRYSFDKTADDAILDFLDRNGSAGYTVVSNDRKVSSGARLRGSAALSVENFLITLGDLPAKETKPGNSQKRRAETKEIPYSAVTPIKKELITYYEKRNQGTGKPRKTSGEFQKLFRRG